MNGFSGRGTSNGISVFVKSELSSMSSEPSSIACSKKRGGGERERERLTSDKNKKW